MKPGQLLGNRYKIVSLLGKGGMGRVYRATDIKLEEEVALKMLEQGIEDEEMMERFIREIKLARTVTHKNICRIYQLEEMEGKQFISMQYIDGEDLATILKREKSLSVERSLPIIKDVLKGLEAIHREGIIHRDLKPANIMIDKKGNSYITDFGIARGGETKGLTQTGSLIGTPEYMAPEQLRGEKVDERTDIYSLGIMMYQIFSGKLPFKADSSISTGLKHLTDEAEPIRKIKPDLPDPLTSLIMECMSKDPMNRPGSVNEVLIRIERFEPPDTDTSATVVDSGDMKTVVFDTKEAEKEADHAMTTPGAPVTEEKKPKKKSALILVPVIFILIAIFITTFIIIKPGAVKDIKDIMLLKSIPLHDNVITSVSFSPDGAYFITGSWDNTCKIIEVNTWKEISIFREHSDIISSAKISPNGKIAVTSSWDKLVKLWDTSSGFTKHTFNGHKDKVNSVDFSPDGKYLVTGSYDGTAKIWNVESGAEVQTLKGHSSYVSSCSFAPNGNYVITGSWDNTAMLWDVKTGKNLVTYKGHTNIVYSAVFSRDTKYIATASKDGTAKIWDTQSGNTLKTLKGHNKLVWSAEFDPLGKYIVSASADKTARLWEIESGKELKVLMGHSGEVNAVDFSPDGELIATGGDDGVVKIWKVLY